MSISMNNSTKNVYNTLISLLQIRNAISQHHIFHVLVSSSILKYNFINSFFVTSFLKNKSDRIRVISINLMAYVLVKALNSLLLW